MSQVWLIGRPVAHSLSPAMHNAAFAKLGLPHRYEAREVAEKDLVATLDRMRRDDDVLGANVTIPYKEAVLRLVDEVDDEARRIGAVNTIVCRGGRLIGDNTDRYGFHNGLEGAGMLVSNADVMVLGAGGAARACILELQVGNDLLVANRSFERAERLVASMPKEKEGELRAISWDEARQVAWVDVLVNATPMG